ncbi:MAG: hypothetical protein Kow0037_24970 [Calditrichia bacterium]
MNELITFKISFLNYLFMLIIGSVIYLALKLVDGLLALKKIKPGWKRAFILLELSTWLLFALWALERTFTEPFYYHAAMGFLFVTFSFLMGWFVIRDYLAGIIFRGQEPELLGKQLTIGSQSGIVERVGHLRISLRSDSGELIKIPYTKVWPHSYTLKDQFERQDLAKLRVRMKVGENLDVTRRKIIRYLLNSPLVIPGFPPQVQALGVKDGMAEFEILLKLHSDLHAEQLQVELEKL